MIKLKEFSMNQQGNFDMAGAKLFIQTLFFTSVPLFLKDITPYFAFISAFFGAILMTQKAYYKIIKPQSKRFIKWIRKGF